MVAKTSERSAACRRAYFNTDRDGAESSPAGLTWTQHEGALGALTQGLTRYGQMLRSGARSNAARTLNKNVNSRSLGLGECLTNFHHLDCVNSLPTVRPRPELSQKGHPGSLPTNPLAAPNKDPRVVASLMLNSCAAATVDAPGKTGALDHYVRHPHCELRPSRWPRAAVPAVGRTRAKTSI